MTPDNWTATLLCVLLSFALGGVVWLLVTLLGGRS